MVTNANAVEGEVVAGAEVAEKAERRESVSTDTFVAFMSDPEVSKLTVVQAAEKLGMSEGSFRTRLSVFRKIATAQGLTVPTLVDGRHGRKGVKRVQEDAMTRAVKALVAKNTSK
jgi:hypothetical protein